MQSDSKIRSVTSISAKEMDFFTTTALFPARNGSNCRAEAGRRAAAAEPLCSDTAARYRGRSLHPMRQFQVAVAARIGSQSICRVQRHRSAGCCQIISSRASAEEFRIRSFVRASRSMPVTLAKAAASAAPSAQQPDPPIRLTRNAQERLRLARRTASKGQSRRFWGALP